MDLDLVNLESELIADILQAFDFWCFIQNQTENNCFYYSKEILSILNILIVVFKED
jgi:hypothetical protein